MPRKPAPPSPVLLSYDAQLATLVAEPPEGNDWLHERKFDGYRIGLVKDGADVSLQSRRNLDWAAQFPEVMAAGRALPARTTILDGEVAVLLPNGVTSFHGLHARTPGSALVYFAFDLLHLDGRDLRELPIEERKRALQKLLGPGNGGTIRYSDHVIGNGQAFFEQASKLGLEGMVSKKLGTRYRPGRNKDWLKTKCVKRQEFVIGGFTLPEGARQGVGAILLGYYEGDQLRWAGKVGTGAGWTSRFLRELRTRFDALAIEVSPFVPPVSDPKLRRTSKWVRPELVAEVSYLEWTNDGHLRHPSMQGLREDKSAKDVVRESSAEQAAKAKGKRKDDG